MGVCAFGLQAPSALASNAAAPRVPPSFLGASCMKVVDASVDPIVHLAIGIPFQDTGLTPDELPDSRTLQFFALCRGPDAMQTMPPWIDADDVARAAAIDPAVGEPGEDDVLATAAPFAGPGHDGADGACIVPIVPSDDRIPITCDATAPGIEWDTTGVPVGAYEVWGYTFEPVASLWTPRPGVVRVVDGDPDDAGPAVAWSWPLSEVTAGLSAGVTLTGCVAGSPGTRVEVAWATAAELQATGDAAWVELTTVDAGESGELAIPLLPPEALLYQATFVRARAIDPEGRAFVATTRAPIVWRPGCDPPEGGTVALADACEVGATEVEMPTARTAGGCAPPDPDPEPDPEPEPATDGEPIKEDAPDPEVATEGCRIGGHGHTPIVLLAAWAMVAAQLPRRRTRVRSCASAPRT